MKKFLSLILALAMVACMSVTAFAADDTTVLTVEVPDNIPSYTFHCPAEVKLEYGNTDKQHVGDVYVTYVSNKSVINCMAPYTDLSNINDSTDTIPLVLFDVNLASKKELELQKSGATIENTMLRLFTGDYQGTVYGSTQGYSTNKLYAQVSDWTGATPGATYQATITYVIH